MQIHDISLPVSEGMVVWEGQPGVALTHVRHLERGDHATVGHVSMTLHTGTHVDAPSHHFVDGLGVDQAPLEVLIGTAVVASAGEAEFAFRPRAGRARDTSREQTGADPDLGIQST